MDNLATNLMRDEVPAVRRPWHRPQLEQLRISVTTLDFLKDGSAEDLDTKTNDFPEVP